MSSQLSFSFELIALMEWLLKHGEKNLKVLIKETMKNGFVQEIDAMEETDFTNISNNLNQTVSDFVIKIEDILFQEIDRVSPKVNIHNALSPAIKNLDNKSLDFATMWTSMQKTKSKIAKETQNDDIAKKATPDIEVRKIWYDQLLKSWKPNGNEPVN